MIRPICASFPRCTPRRGKPARIPHHRKHRRSPVECHILRRGWKRKGRGERARCADKDGKKGRARKKEREGGTKKRGKRNDGGMGRDGERRRGVQARPATGGMKKVENRYRQKRIFSSRISRFFPPLHASSSASSFDAFHGRIEDMFTLLKGEESRRTTPNIDL